MIDGYDPQAVLIAYAQALSRRFSSELRATVFHDDQADFHALLFAIFTCARMYQVCHEHGEGTSEGTDELVSQFTALCETLYLVDFQDGQAQANMNLPQVE